MASLMLLKYVPLLIWAFPIFLGLAGAWAGWRLGTNRLYRRTTETPYRLESTRRNLTQRKLDRVILTVAGASAGTILALGLLILLAGTRRF